MNFLVLLVSFVFAATVHANSKLPKVLVLKGHDAFYPLSFPFKAASSASEEVPLVWGHPLGVPVEFTHAQSNSLVSTNISPSRYLSLNLFKPLTLQKTRNRHTFTRFIGPHLSENFTSCTDSKYILGSSNSTVYKTVMPVTGAQSSGCINWDVYLVPYDRKTRKILFGEDKDETATFLTVPADNPLGLFIVLEGVWYPLTIDYVGPNQDSYSLLYNVDLQYPLDFEIVNKQLVSRNKNIPGFACFEQSSVAIFKSPCSKPITLGEGNVVSEKKIYVCNNDKKLYYQKSEGCQAVEIHLHYYERGINWPLTTMPVVGIDRVPRTVAEAKITMEVNQYPKDDTRKTGLDSHSPKFPLVFLLKVDGSFVPLSTRLFKDNVSHFYYDKSKSYPEFEYIDGIATTKYGPTPGFVMFDEGNLLVGRTDNPAVFNVDKNGIVDHEFYLCGLKSDYERALFISHPGDTYSNCAKEDVYFLPYDKVTETVPGWKPEIPPVKEPSLVNSTGKTNQEVTPDKSSQNTTKIPEKKLETKGTNSTAKGNKDDHATDSKVSDVMSDEARPSIEVAGTNIQESGSELESSGSKQEISKGTVPESSNAKPNKTEEAESLDTLKEDTLKKDTLKGSQTKVWKTYTDYTTYCPEPTTVTMIVCDEKCVPSTKTVQAGTTLTVTGKCIVPETTTVGKAKDTPGPKKIQDQTNGQKQGSKPSQPKSSKPGESEASELKAGSAKVEDKSRNSGNGEKTGTKSIQRPTVEPFVNSASKNALGVCVLGFAALLL